MPLLALLHRVSHYCLKDDLFVSRNLQGLLERGVQKSMDVEEPKGPVDPSTPPLDIETMLGYTGVLPLFWVELETPLFTNSPSFSANRREATLSNLEHFPFSFALRFPMFPDLLPYFVFRF